MNGERSSPLEMAEERRSWSSLSPESPFSVEVMATFRRDLVEFIGFGGGLFGVTPSREVKSITEMWLLVV
ncbi:hypothetical protein Hanom_Chr04g00350721 [Helianthus anomalus]